MGDVDQSFQRTAVRKEIINDQQGVICMQLLLGDNDIVVAVVGIGMDDGVVDLIGDVAGTGFFGKYHRHLKVQTGDDGNTDPAGFDCQDLVDGRSFKQTFELFSHFVEKRDVHLVIQEAVDLQHVPRVYDTVFAYAIF